MTGRQMQKRLTECNVVAQHVTCKRQTGDYVAEFYHPELAEGVDPARTWAKRIQNAIPEANILVKHDTIASWRPGLPVIFATVIFNMEET